jgi:hypothetical protein
MSDNLNLKSMNYEEKLHEEARILMEELDEKYGMDNMISLDEYLYEYFDLLTEGEKKTINYLLNQFSNL